ncbi:hypothetical protein ACFS07_24730 [Undibacterium arcticum]
MPRQLVRRQCVDALDVLNQPLQSNACIDDGALQAGLRSEALCQLRTDRLI